MTTLQALHAQRRGSVKDASAEASTRQPLILPGRPLDSFLNLFEGTNLDLPDALAADTELRGKILERDWFLCQPAGFENAPLTVAEARQGILQIGPAARQFLRLDQDLFLVGPIVHQPVLPLA